VTVWAVLFAAELAGAAALPGLLLLGLAGIAGVVAIGSAVIALGARRPVDDEEVPAEIAP
jgi:hypothetical protein